MKFQHVTPFKRDYLSGNILEDLADQYFLLGFLGTGVEAGAYRSLLTYGKVRQAQR